SARRPVVLVEPGAQERHQVSGHGLLLSCALGRGRSSTVIRSPSHTRVSPSRATRGSYSPRWALTPAVPQVAMQRLPWRSHQRPGASRGSRISV
ncbi:hypothetical protein ACWDA7_44100, partial [Streptomyces sp. NPDC001156]